MEGRFSLRIDREEIHENKIVCSNTMQITLDDDFNVPDSKEDIAVIVKERGNVHIDTVKVSADRAEVAGGMDFAVLYAGSKGGEKKTVPVKMTGTMNISEVINLPQECDNTYASCQAKLEDITVKMIHSRKLSVKAIVSLTVICEEIQDTPIGCGLLEQQEEDKLQLKTTDVSYSQLAVTMHDNLRIRESFMIPASKPEAAELLWEDVDIRSFSTRLTDDGMEISGEMNVFIMYSPTEETGVTQWYETTQNFSGKLDVGGCTPDMISYVKYTPVNSNTEVKPDYDGENKEVQVELVLALDVKVYEEKEKTILTDVYSPIKEVVNTTKQSVFHKLIVRNNSKCRAADRLNTGEYNNILQICNCTGEAQIDDVTVEEDGLLVDGAIIANVFYVTSNDSSPLGSIRAAVPFSNKIQINSDGPAENMEYVINAGVEQLSAAMTGSNEMEIKGSVGLDTICFAPCETESVMECEVKEYEENEFLKFPSIIGYVASGEETLWDIAKKYHTTIDSIKNGNHIFAERTSDRVKRGDKLLLVKSAR